MKNLYKNFMSIAIVATMLLMSITNLNAVEVTFKVDMSEQEVSPLGLHIAGSFQGWNPGATQMTKSPFNDVYSYTHTFQGGESIEFKYVNGNAWGTDESVPFGCAQNGNRFLLVPDEDIALTIVCFGSCNICNPQPVEITFQVDMSNQIVNPNGVHVAGNFQGWDPSATEMLHVGNNIYAVTVPIGQGEYVAYKFINGNTWGGGETVPPACAAENNRFFTVTTAETLPAVCFGSCDPCSGAVVDVEITFIVDMSQQEISPDGIHIAGGFQGWNPGSTLMSDAGNGIYTYTAILQSDSYQEYKFVNGDEWGEDEIVPAECAGGTNNNRFFTTPAINTTLETVCYGLCGPCPEPLDVNVTFRVDMSEQVVSENGVYLMGSFNNFDPTATLMELLDDGNYAATLVLTENDQHTYKFVNGNTLADAETVPVECANVDGYRELTIPGEDLLLENVCFAACDPCIPPPVVDVTFRVDMSNEEISPEGIHLAGSFQGWNPATTPMTGVGNGIYELTLELVTGEHHTYKYINGIAFENEEFVPEACGEENLVGGYDRFLDVPETDLVLDLVCFGSCTECQAQIEVEVQFYVDMSLEILSPNGVHLAGSFNDFSTTATPMQDAGNNMYSATVTLISGSHISYKFINGNTFEGEESVPAECGEDNGFGGYNRYFDVMEEGNNISPVCFSSCEECVAAEVPVTFKVDMSNEVVSEDGVHLAGSFNDFIPANSPMTDLGNGIWETTLILLQADYHTYYFVNGLDQGETVPGECAQDDGFREVLVPADTLSLDAVCFSQCGPCIPPPTANVTFSVDMSNENISPEGVFIVGSFQDWTLSATPMTLTTDNIYTYSTDLIVGETIEFKYMNGITWDDAEQVPEECAQNFNRFLSIPETSTILDLVCFGSCSECIPPVEVNITFQVDMSNEIVSEDGVYLVGSFQGWTIDSTQMTLAANNIYAYTATLIAGNDIEYKYVNGLDWDNSEIVPEECSIGWNRFLTTPQEATMLDAVCFASCNACNRDQSITLFEGWNSLSSYRLPDETNIEMLMSQIEAELVVIQTITEVYYPAGGINTIGIWESQSAYKIKVNQDVVLNITGIVEQSKTLQLEEGWNLIPVLSDEPTDVAALFAGVIDKVIVVKAIAEIGVFWPAFNINTLVNAIPGKAYFVKMSAAGEITYP